MRPPDRAGFSSIGERGTLVSGVAMRSPEFHRDVADAIVRVWRLRQQAFGYDVDPDESPVGEHVAMRVPRAGEPGLITWAPSTGGTPPRLSTVAEMTASIARCYDLLVPRANIAEYDAAPTKPIALWVVAVGDLGGVARHVLDATRVGIPGWRIFVLCPEGPLADRLRAQGAAVLTAPISPADSLADGLSAVRHAVRTLRPAVVHSHLAYSDFLVAGATTGSPPKLVSTEHGIAGNDLVYHGTRWKSRVMELAHSARLRRFDALIAVSQATLDAVRRKWHPQRGLRTVVIPNGVDAPATLPEPVAGRFHVISLSRLAPEKGLFDLLEAFKLVYDEQPEARLTMAGEGPLGSQLEQRVAELGLDQVVAMPGYVEAQKLLAEGDVLVQLSTWENCSYTLLDAITLRRALVATSIGGNRYLLDPTPDRSWNHSRMQTRPTPVVAAEPNQTNPGLGESTRISIIIPAYNAEHTLGMQLEALSTQQDAPPFEVIVVDNGSRDGTRRVAEAWARALPSLRVITSAKHQGESYARNVGVRHSAGNLLFFCDADDVVSRWWVTHGLNCFESTPVWSGSAIPVSQSEFDAPIAEIRRKIGDSSTWEHLRYDQDPIFPVMMGGNFGITRDLFYEVGGFDQSTSRSGADNDFALRLARLGVYIPISPVCRLAYRKRIALGDMRIEQYRAAYAQALLATRFNLWADLPVANLAGGYTRLAIAATRMLIIPSRRDWAGLSTRAASLTGTAAGKIRFRYLSITPSTDVGRGLYAEVEE